ncbi:hypothetical protein HK101_011319 [Irineochytrium annulatum]|nr:hypothetical protein HK101_011319 [Irineochytrium annulatum]
MSKLCIVTGANRGIGFGIVKLLCERASKLDVPVTVYLTSRDQDRGKKAIEEAKEHLAKLNLKPEFTDVRPAELDISSKASIVAFRDYIKKMHSEKSVDVLINNSGIAYKGDAFDDEVITSTVGTNYYGTRHMIEEFLPLMHDGGKIINISSRAGLLSRNLASHKKWAGKFKVGDVTPDDIEACLTEFREAAKTGDVEKQGFKKNSYGMSKALLNGYIRYLAKKTQGTCDVVAVCPGWVKTDMGGENAHLGIEEGADTATWLALEVPFGEANGKFYAERKRGLIGKNGSHSAPDTTGFSSGGSRALKTTVCLLSASATSPRGCHCFGIRRGAVSSKADTAIVSTAAGAGDDAVDALLRPKCDIAAPSSGIDAPAAAAML